MVRLLKFVTCVGWPGWLALGAGCAEQAEAPEVLPLAGVVESVDVRTQTIAVRLHNANHGRDEIHKSRLTALTEVWIDGVAGDLADIRVGERVAGHVRVGDRGGGREVQILRIMVDRRQPEDARPPEAAVTEAVAEPGG